MDFWQQYLPKRTVFADKDLSFWTQKVSFSMKVSMKVRWCQVACTAEIQYECEHNVGTWDVIKRRLDQ